MSWWSSTSGLTNIASTAFKNAQKKIDTVLDINEPQTKTAVKDRKSTPKAPPAKKDEGTGDFWNAWLSPSSSKETPETAHESTPTSSSKPKRTYSSWSSWGFGGEEAATTTEKPSLPDVAESAEALEIKQTRLPSTKEEQHVHSKTASMDELKNVSLTDSSVLVGESLDVEDLALLAEGDSTGVRDHVVSYEAAISDENKVDVGQGNVISDASRVNDDETSSVGHDSSFSYGITSMFNKLETGVLALAKDLTPRKKNTDKTTDIAVEVPSIEEGRTEKIDCEAENLTVNSNEETRDGIDETNIPSIEPVDQENLPAISTPDICRDKSDETINTDTVCELSNNVQTLPDVISDQGYHAISDNISQSDYLLDVEPSNMMDLSDTEFVNTSSTAIEISDVESANMELSYVEPFNNELCKVELPDVKLSDVELSKVESSSIESSKVEGSCHKPSMVEPSDVELSGVESSNVGLNNVEPSVESYLSLNELHNDEMAEAEELDVVDTAPSYDISVIAAETSNIKYDGSDETAEADIDAEIDNMESESELSSLDVDKTVGECAITSGELDKSAIEASQESDAFSAESYLELMQMDPPEQSDSSGTSKLDSSCGSGETVTHGDEIGSNSESFVLEDGAGFSEKIDRKLADVDPIESGITNDNLPSDKISPSSSSGDSLPYQMTTNQSLSSSVMKSSLDDFSYISSDLMKSEQSDIEIDTTTSSDIEIISTPTPNGDRESLDLSPLKISLSQSRPPTFHRRDDSSDSSCYSRPDHPSPERDTHSPERCESLLKICDDPYHPDKLLKKLADMSEVVQARETKLLQMSKENNDLMERNSIISNQLQQLETSRELEMLDINTLTEEFTERLGISDKKVIQFNKDKESLMKQIEMLKEELVARKESHQSAYHSLLEEKDEEIKELRHEGEKLSKQQLQINQIIKKLRSKEKDNETTTQTQKKKIEDLTSENEHLKNVLDSKEALEKKQASAISELNSAVSQQDRHSSQTRSELEESQEKCRSLQATLDSSYREIVELNKAKAAMDSQVNEAALSAEIAARDALKMSLFKEQAQHRQEQDNLQSQIEDLRVTMSRMEKDHGRREDMLRGEISYLQQRVQEGEDRNQELTNSITSATRPLLRQIENLQSTFGAQSSSWDKLERNLTERLADLQTQLAVAVEQERLTSDNLAAANTKLVTQQAQISTLKQDKSRALAKLDMYQAKLDVLEDSKNNDQAQIEIIRHTLNQEISDLKRDKVTLENQLDLETTKVESERKKTLLLMDQLKEKETETIRHTPSPLNLSTIESYHSEASTPVVGWTPDLLEHSLISYSPDGANKISVYDSVRLAGTATVIESLTAKLKQQEGEIAQLRSDITYLESTRESMARELVDITTRNDELQQEASKLHELTDNIQVVEGRNNALLQMYGEKVEEVQELRLDLSDIRDLYRTQIDQLTQDTV